MDDTTYATYAAYQRELAPHRDAHMAELAKAWAAYQERIRPSTDAYQSAINQLRGKYRLNPPPYGLPVVR